MVIAQPNVRKMTASQLLFVELGKKQSATNTINVNGVIAIGI